MTSPLIEVEHLTRDFAIGRGIPLVRPQRRLRAVNDVSFQIHAGETLGLVGESGCGKSTVGKLVLGLLPPTEGDVRYQGDHIPMPVGSTGWRALRAQMQMVFQNPFGALNPRMSVKSQIREVLETHAIGDPTERGDRTADLLKTVGLERHLLDRFPHQLSGGQLQRVVIARALAPSPRFLVCDEAVAALDVSIQAQVINLLQDLQEERGLTYLFISHDLGVVGHVCDRIAVMYLGRIVETGPADAVIAAPLHPYSRALIDAAPRPHPRYRRQRIVIEGDPPSPLNPPSGCVFRTRCPSATAECAAEPGPRLRQFGDHGRFVACHHANTPRLEANAAAIAKGAMI